MSEGRFRTALNGFNRQDVAAYIEGMAQRSKAVKEERDSLEQKLLELTRNAETGEERRKALETGLEEQKALLRDAETRLGELSQALCAAEKKNAALQGQLETLQAASRDQAAFAQEMDELRRKNADLERELDRSETQYRQAVEQAEEYALVKERVLKLELNASRRAVEIEQNAARRAEELVNEAEGQTARLNQEREELLRRFRGEISRISRELGFQAELLDQQAKQLVTSLREASGAMEESSARIGSFQEPEQPCAEGTESGTEA